MRFDYNTMREYARRKEPIGKYNGVLVFSMRRINYQDLQDDKGYYYLIYDDGNYIVRDNYIYALLSENGNLHEYNEKRVYLKDKDEESAVVQNMYNVGTNVVADNNIMSETPEVKPTPVDNDPSSVFFDRISQEIDNILKGDFNYEVGTN